MKNELYYRRQFLLTKAPISYFADWNCLRINQFFLYTHPELGISKATKNDRTIAIIGEIYSATFPHKKNIDILNDIINRPPGVDELISWMKQYTGRYTLFYQDISNTIMFPDALALREVYYCTTRNQIVCGSQPNLIAEFSSPKIKFTDDSPLLNFFLEHSAGFKWDPKFYWVGDDTIYKNVKHLLPNHYLDIKKLEAIRFWPNCQIRQLELSDAVSKGCSLLQGFIKAMAGRHPIMLAVTAGYDSRTLLAASRGLEQNIYYFINNENLGLRHPDIKISLKIFKMIGLPLNIHDVTPDISEQFEKIFLKNVFFASKRILRTIYNVYFKTLQNKVNVIGIGEIGRTRFGKDPARLQAYRLAYKMGHQNQSYALEKCEQILREMMLIYKKNNINLLTGFYWEQYLGNWGSTGNSESDIAIEEVNAMNSHQFYEILLGVEDKYTRYSNNILFKAMIRKMWPELIKFPFNPPSTVKGYMKRWLNQIGIFNLIKEIKFQFYYFIYTRQQRRSRGFT